MPRRSSARSVRNSVAALQQLCERFDEGRLPARRTSRQPFQQVLTATGLKLGKFGPAVRIALTGGTVSPGIYEVVAVLGDRGNRGPFARCPGGFRRCCKNRLTLAASLFINSLLALGVSPSGKAADSDSAIRGFKS